MLVAQYMKDQYQGHFYCKAQNVARRLKAAYDGVLAQYDLLLMPTLPIVASPLPAPSASKTEIITRAFEMTTNTCPFDATGMFCLVLIFYYFIVLFCFVFVSCFALL